MAAAQTAQQSFNAAQQARYDGLLLKYDGWFQESSKLDAEAKALLEPYMSRRLPAMGEAFYEAHAEAARKNAQALNLYSKAIGSVQNDFWAGKSA